MKPFKYILPFLCIVSLAAANWEKTVKAYPAIGKTPDFGKKAQNDYTRLHELAAKEFEQLNDAEKKEFDALHFRFGYGDFWEFPNYGCDWYCVGGPYHIEASSSLKAQGSNSYDAKNAHDLRYDTAWIEGAEGDGTGEYLEYFFENASPRITKIKIYNGYIKSEQAWKENGRVKTLGLSVNGVPFARIYLKDSRALQTVTFEPLGRRADGHNLVLRFEILDVYPGTKYSDTAITQIYFDGLDSH